MAPTTKFLVEQLFRATTEKRYPTIMRKMLARLLIEQAYRNIELENKERKKIK